MRWIEPSIGEGFLMGSSPAERMTLSQGTAQEHAINTEDDPHWVPIQHGFWLADTPCTQGFFLAVTGQNPSHFEQPRESVDLPVEWVPLKAADLEDIDVERFFETLNQGLTKGFARLPTEREWEYAARADVLSQPYWWGKRFSVDRGNANTDGKKARHSSTGTTPVKRFEPNPWGLYDMHGNVWEWTASSWGPTVAKFSVHDMRTVRGGSWLDHPDWCRAASRYGMALDTVSNELGFRIAISPLRS
jgi:formylglycine-generating enzyme required for sulfatase activity